MTNERTAPVSYGEIAGAVTRGWCWPKNQHKPMDANLAMAITVEVNKLLATAPPSEPKAERELAELKGKIMSDTPQYILDFIKAVCPSAPAASRVERAAAVDRADLYCAALTVARAQAIEECAKVCINMEAHPKYSFDNDDGTRYDFYALGLSDAAQAIRALTDAPEPNAAGLDATTQLAVDHAQDSAAPVSNVSKMLWSSDYDPRKRQRRKADPKPFVGKPFDRRVKP